MESEWASCIFAKVRNGTKPHVVDFDHCVESYYDSRDKELVSCHGSESFCDIDCIECASKNWEGQRKGGLNEGN